MTAPPLVLASHSVTNFNPDALHMEVKLCEVAYTIAEDMAKGHPDLAKHARYKPQHAWREELKTQCGVHRNKTGLEGKMAHMFLETRGDWLKHLQGHQDHAHFTAYLDALATMLDEMWAPKPDLPKYAAAAATVHCIRVGLLIRYVPIGVYEHAAFVHVFDLLVESLAKHASLFLESGNAVWKGPLTRAGNWGAGAGLKAEQDQLRKRATEARRAGFAELAGRGCEEIAAAWEASFSAALSVEQAVCKNVLRKRSTKTAMVKYLTMTLPRVSKFMRAMKKRDGRVSSGRLQQLHRFKLPMAPNNSQAPEAL